MEGCPARGKPPERLREHFMFRNWKLKVAILQEGTEPLPQCEQWGMHMQAGILFKHIQSDKCNKSTERRLQQRYVEMAARCGEMEFSIEGGD